jgi:regulator of nucleoside diphosphate kinase
MFAKGIERRRANMPLITAPLAVITVIASYSRRVAHLLDNCRPFNAFSDFTRPHPLAPSPRKWRRARAVRAAFRRRAVANASARNASASRRPAPHLTQFASLPEAASSPRGLSGRRADHIRMMFPHTDCSHIADRIGVAAVKTTRMTKQCYLTELDVARLEKHAAAPGADARLHDMLDDVLERAVIVDSREIPANVVTMNSQATLVDESSGEHMTWTVVYPPDADFAHGRLNVFSPVGLALLGAKRGEQIRFVPPSGAEKVLKLEKILYQPEASDDFTL